MSEKNKKSDGLENIGSILDRSSTSPGRQHFKIVDADPADDDLPGILELTGDGLPSADAPSVTSSTLSQSPKGSWMSNQLKARRAEREARAASAHMPMLPAHTQPPRSRELVPLPHKKSTAEAVPIPEPMEQPPVCQICHGAGFLRQDVPYGHPAFGKPTPCRCKLQSRTQTLFGGAHIPSDFSFWSFESYQRLPLSNEQSQAAKLVQAFMRPRIDQTYSGHKRGLYLYGSWGVGKTGLAISALQMAIQAGYSGLYLPTVELFNILYESIAASQRLMRGYGDEVDREEESAGAKLLRLVEQVEWLVLDDLGVECSSRFVISRLYRIIEGRRSEPGRYTIFTSNKDARGLEHHWRPEQTDAPAFDDCQRVIQRIGEYSTPIYLTGQNLREKHGDPHSS